MTNGKLLKKIFPNFEELRIFNEYILRDNGHVVIKVDCDFWDSSHTGDEQEPCDDAISRQAVLDETYNWSKDEFLRVTNPFDYLRKRINSLPSVTPVSNISIQITEREKYGRFN